MVDRIATIVERPVVGTRIAWMVETRAQAPGDIETARHADHPDRIQPVGILQDLASSVSGGILAEKLWVSTACATAAIFSCGHPSSARIPEAFSAASRDACDRSGEFFSTATQSCRSTEATSTSASHLLRHGCAWHFGTPGEYGQDHASRHHLPSHAPEAGSERLMRGKGVGSEKICHVIKSR